MLSMSFISSHCPLSIPLCQADLEANGTSEARLMEGNGMYRESFIGSPGNSVATIQFVTASAI